MAQRTSVTQSQQKYHGACVSQLAIAVTKCLRKSTHEDGKVYVGSGFQKVPSMATWLCCWGDTVRQNITKGSMGQRKAAHLVVDRSKERGEGQGPLCPLQGDPHDLLPSGPTPWGSHHLPVAWQLALGVFKMQTLTEPPRTHPRARDGLLPAHTRERTGREEPKVALTMASAAACTSSTCGRLQVSCPIMRPAKSGPELLTTLPCPATAN